MSRVTELEKALTTLFRKGTEVGYTETEIDEFLENIDYHALLQAVWNKAETVYAYRADGKNALSLDYRSAELFKQRATLLYDRTFHVLAITVCQADWDRRYSPDNRAWANAMSIPANPDTWGTDRNCYLAVNSHPGLVDLFLSQTRKAYAQERQKTSVRDKLKKPPETTSPKISAKSKAPER